MNAVTRWLAMICVLATIAGAPVCAAPPASSALPEATPTPAPAPELAGQYYLEGIMETGSELLLRADGRFQWYFTYGALDLDAEGRWQREKGTAHDTIVLLPDTFHFPPQYPETEFKRMQLRIDGEDLIPAWPWDGGAERGRYTHE